MAAGNRIGMAEMPDNLHGPTAFGRHAHAYWLSEDLDRDGLIDHLTMVSGAAISPTMVGALATTNTLHLSQIGEWQIAPVYLGAPPAALVGPAHTWRAATAHVTALDRTTRTGNERAHLSPEKQIERELARQLFPAPICIKWRNVLVTWAGKLPPTGFATRAQGRSPPADAACGFPQVTFAEPVLGPVALGFGAHFGLGMLLPVSDHRPGV